MSTFQNDLDHIYITYRHLIQFIPSEKDFGADAPPLDVGRTKFENYNQARSMLVEMGWAFFTRMEACLEAFLHKNKIHLTQKKELLDYLEKDLNISLNNDQKNGLRRYRELRNCLHHGDGDASLLNRKPQFLDKTGNTEPHLFENHVRNYYELFSNVGQLITGI